MFSQKNNTSIKKKSIYLLTSILILLTILSSIQPGLSVTQISEQTNKGIILFDESHINPDADYSVGNFASDRAMKDPVTLLRDQGFKVKVNSKEITLDLLNKTIGSNGLLIMTLLDDPVSESEGLAIKQWVEAGGSLLTTTQPDYAGFGYSKNENTNDLLQLIGVYDTVHIYSQAGESDEIVDDNPSHRAADLTGNIWDVKITQDNFADTELGNALKQNVESVIIGSSSLVVTNASWVGAFAYNESYSQPDGGIDPYDPSLNGFSAIPWIAGGTIGNGGKVLVTGGTFTVSGWSLYSTSLKFIEQASNAILWSNMVSWLMSVEVSIPVIVEKIKVPLIDLLSMAVGGYALIVALTARKGQRRFLRYLAVVGSFGLFSSILGYIQHIMYEWQYIGSGLDRYWSLPQDADPVMNAAVRYLFAGLAGPVLISLIPVLFIVIARSKRVLGKELVVSVINLRVSTPIKKYEANKEIFPTSKRIIAFLVDIAPFVVLFIVLYAITNFESSVNTFLSRDLIEFMKGGVGSAKDTSAITNIDFLQLIIRGSISLLLIPLQVIIFIIQFTTASLFTVGLIFIVYYTISLKVIGCTLGQKITGAYGFTNYQGERLTFKRILLKTIFLMFIDSGLFFLSTLRLISKEDNQLKQSYSDKLVRAVIVQNAETIQEA